MRPSLVKFSESEASNHTTSFGLHHHTTPELKFSIHTGVERRRRWSRDDKMRIIEETLAPGAVVTDIARRHGIATSLVFTWRRRARLATATSAGPRLVPFGSLL
jgi:transposase-like protein